MPNLVTLELNLLVEPSQRRSLVPAGTIAAMRLEGVGTYSSYLVRDTNLEVAVPIDPVLARRVMGSFARHQSHKSAKDADAHSSNCGNNCLTFVAESQNWPVTDAEQFPEDDGPVLVPGRYKELANIAMLTPDKPHGVVDARSRVMHGFLSTRLPDRILDIDGSTYWGDAQMRLAPLGWAFEDPSFETTKVVELSEGSYEATAKSKVVLC